MKYLLYTFNVMLIVALIALNILSVTNSVVHNAIYKMVDMSSISFLKQSSPTGKIQRIEEKHKALKNRTKYTMRKIARRTVSSVSRNLASSVSESIPYIGVSAVIISLALDIDDACETMKDIDDLEAILSPHEDSDLVERNTRTICGISIDDLRNKY